MSGQPLTRKAVRAATALVRRIAIGRVPKLFDAAYYLRRNEDVAASGVDPFLHYVWRGAGQDRDPAEDVDTAFLRRQSGPTRLDPLRHYIREGAKAGLDPNPSFSTTSYLVRYPDVAASGTNPLLHYRLYGRREGREAQASAAKGPDLVALRGVPSRFVRRLPPEDGGSFAIRLLRAPSGERAVAQAPRLCVLLTLGQDEIAMLVGALATMETGAHEAIVLEPAPETGLHPSQGTLLLAFEHGFFAEDDGTFARLRYGELRVWDLRPRVPRVTEIFPAGAIAFERLRNAPGR